MHSKCVDPIVQRTSEAPQGSPWRNYIHKHPPTRTHTHTRIHTCHKDRLSCSTMLGGFPLPVSHFGRSVNVADAAVPVLGPGVSLIPHHRRHRNSGSAAQTGCFVAVVSQVGVVLTGAVPGAPETSDGRRQRSQTNEGTDRCSLGTTDTSGEPSALHLPGCHSSVGVCV